jgi:putative endonuclease
MYFVYVIYSSSLGKFYKGSTSDLEDRIQRHNHGYEKASKPGVPWKLLWKEEKPNKSEAQVLEFKLKNLSQKRLVEFMLKYKDGVASPDELLLLEQLSGC